MRIVLCIDDTDNLESKGTGALASQLARESAAGSDPGLCVVDADRLGDPAPLVAFGRKAKQSVVAMEEAYGLAKSLGVHLSEHGGSGQGIIGALAGAGLRLSGNDGRLKGHLSIEAVNGRAAVGKICAHPEVDEVRSLDGRHPEEAELVLLGEKVKTVLLDGKSVLLVVPAEGTDSGVAWQTCSKQQLRNY